MEYITINKFSMIPLYAQLKEAIKTAILNGILKPGDKIPTEHEICEAFELSRTVTRQAFYELMNEGYIIRFKSRGTFVSHPNQRTSFFKQIMSFNDEMRMNGYEPKTVLIGIEEMPCPKDIAKKLNVLEGTPLVRIQRLRYRDNVPVVFVDAYVKADAIQGIEAYDIEKNSLYDVLEEHFHIKIMHTQKQFTAKIIDDQYAEYLKVKKKSAVQYVESIEYDQQDTPISFDISLYVGDRNVFEIEINNLRK